MLKRYFSRLVILTAVLLAGLLPFGSAYAVTASDWRAGRIIDDSVFTNAYSMSVNDIQSFLNGKVPACDTYGAKPSDMGGVDYDGNGTITRREYAQYRGYGTNFIFTCLRDYWEVPKTTPGDYIPANNYGGKPIPAGAKSAAQLIADAAAKYSISPKALLVKLATESAGPLTSDDWPFPKQYYYAMGAHCPDSGPNGSANCDSNYAGFSIQMDEAASLLRWYLDSMQTSWWTYKRPFQTNSILWNVVERGCGAGNVYIESKATAALYTYTPYQPNDAALRNMYGEGDYCSAYGNRNFWRVWNDWFGPTREGVTISSPLEIKGVTNSGVFTNSQTTVSFNITNDSWTAVDIGGMFVSVRDSQNRNYDYPLRAMTIPARSTVQYKETQSFSTEGAYTFEIGNYSNGYWNNTYPLSNYPATQRKVTLDVRNMPTLTAGLNPLFELRASLAQALSVTVKNNSAYRMDVGRVGIGVRGPNNENMDIGTVAVALDPGQSQQVSMSFRPPYEGKYQIFVVATRDNKASWESNYPAPVNSAIKNFVELTAKPQVMLTGSVVSSNPDPRQGQQTQLSFKVKNYGDTSIDLGKLGLWGRDPQNRNIDPGVIPVTLAAGEERQVTFGALNINELGKYQFGVLGTFNNGTTWTSGPAIEAGQANRIEFAAKEGVVVSSGVAITPTTTHTGAEYNVTFKVKNHKLTSVDLGKLGLWGRDPQNRNIDPGVIPVTLAPGEERQITFGFKPLINGAYSFGLLQTHDNGKTWSNGPVVESGTSRATRDFTSPVTVISSVTASPLSLHKNENATVSYTLKNNSDTSIDLGKLGLWGRDPQNRNIDPGVIPVTLAAGEERQITFGLKPLLEGAYSFGVLSTVDSGQTWGTGPVANSASIQKTIKHTVKSQVTVTASPSLTGPATVGSCGAIGYSVRNHGDTLIDLGKLGLWGRDPQNRNIDPGVIPVTLAAGEERQVALGSCFTVKGEYKYGILSTPDSGKTWANGPTLENDTLLREIRIPVN